MNDRLSSTSVVGEIVRETEGFFAERVYEFLLFLDTLLVKDSAELIEGILCVTAERRDILRRILPDVDGFLCNGNFYCEKCIVLRMLFLLLLQFLPSEAFFQRFRYFIQSFDGILFLTAFCYLEPPFSSIFSSCPQL